MKVILLQDVKSLGKKDQIVEVSDGYARNMLLPKKLGMEATSKNLNDLKLKNLTHPHDKSGVFQFIQRTLDRQLFP